MSISILISTIGKDSLIDMLNSLKNQLSENDYLYVIVDGIDYHQKVRDIVSNFNNYACNLEVIYEDNNLGHWGHGIRNKYQKVLKGDYILHADDDDIYIDGSIEIIKSSILNNLGKMLLFKFYTNYSKREYVWKEPSISFSNIGTPSGAIPNIPERMGTWGYKYGGDFDFYTTCNFESVFIDDCIYIVRPEKKKILFLVLTTEGYKDRQDNIIKTWGKDVDLIFYSEHEDKDRTVLKVCDENSAEIKQCKILNFLENYEKKYDWYFFCDDDTFVNVNLLNKKIIDFNKNCIVGKNIKGYWPTKLDLSYPSGGAGFLIHKSKISKFYNIKSYNTSWSDVSVGLKMRDENIRMKNSNLFMWFSYDDEREFVKLEDVDKYITFHYINTFEKMNTLYEICK